MRKGLAGAAFIVIAGAVAPSYSNGAVRKFTQAEMCILANQIVVATVEDRDSQYMADSTTILTTVTLSVDYVITGSPGATVVVKTLGGKIGNQVQHFGDEPAMPAGSRYLLLMNKQPGSPALLIGGVLGARRLDPSSALPTEQEMVDEWHEACDEYL